MSKTLTTVRRYPLLHRTLTDSVCSRAAVYFSYVVIALNSALFYWVRMDAPAIVQHENARGSTRELYY
jgi:hypothetical protein